MWITPGPWAFSIGKTRTKSVARERVYTTKVPGITSPYPPLTGAAGNIGADLHQANTITKYLYPLLCFESGVFGETRLKPRAGAAYKLPNTFKNTGNSPAISRGVGPSGAERGTSIKK
ncbi:hypothetical protein AYM39_12530 [Methylomonas sp. DH-1]|nr:hypothetical protein AYM39_12530 [Methylomonas sp. DH-1]